MGGSRMCRGRFGEQHEQEEGLTQWRKIKLILEQVVNYYYGP